MVRIRGIIFFLLLAASSLLAQTTGGDLTGEVRDPDGAVIAGARVVVANIATEISTTSQTTKDGVYAFTNLAPGTYRVTITSAGFAEVHYADVRVRTGARQRLDIFMSLRRAERSVSVNAQANAIQSDSADLQQSTNDRQIVALPLNGRNFVQLITLAPGVALPPGTFLPRINGGRPRTNEYLFDGISALQPEPGQVAFFPIVDAIQEFNVQSSAVSAEFGRFNGGVVNLTTRAGGNAFHGTVFTFVRNEALNARNYFAPGSSKPLSRRDQYGATVGGPIVRARTFFFLDYQGTRQALGTVRVSTVPTLLQRQGIFTEAIGGKVATIFDPATTKSNGNTFTRTAFPNNTVPQNRIDPVAARLLSRYPLPTQSGTANNFTRVGNDDDHQHQADARLDHRFSDSNQAFARYSYFHDIENPVTPLPDGSGNIATGAIALTTNVGQQVVGGYNHAFGGNFLNEFRFGYTRRSANTLASTLDAPPAQSLKLPGIPSNAAFSNAIPGFVISGLQQIGAPSNANAHFKTDVTELADTVSRQLGRHTLRFGADLRWEQLDVLQPPNPTGVFDFSQLFTDQPGVSGTGNALASFLLGQVQQFSIDLQTSVIRPRAHIAEFFVQDDWKLSHRLTVNAGVRYTLNFPSTEARDQGAVFNLQTRKLDYLGRNGFSRSARELHWGDLGPRLGLAYLVTPKTVFRGGYGIVWIEQTGITTPFTTPQFPFLQTISQRTLDNVNPAFVLANGPAVSVPALTPDAGLGQGVFAVDRHQGSGYVQQWNAAVERELWRGMSVQAAYTGSHITHVGVPDVNINQLTPQQLAQGNALLQRVANPYFGVVPRSSSIGDPTIPLAQLLKPFPAFTTVALYRDNTGSTVYHAGELRLQQHLSHGMSFLVSYTHSKLIDTASSVFSASVLTGPIANFPVADSFDSRRERDSSTGDMPNVFSASYTWDLPAGVGHRFASSGWANALLGGWQLAGIVTWQSGMPVAIIQATNFNAFAGYGVQRPNVVADPALLPGERTPSHFFNTAAFQVAPQFTLGNSSRNPVRGPAFRDGDIALIRRARIRESAELEIRAEMFNLTNTPAFAQPNGTLGTAAFGTITSTVADPRVVQFGLRFRF